MEKLYTKEEVAKHFGVEPKTVSNWISQRAIDVVRGRPVMFTESAIEKFIRMRTKRALQGTVAHIHS